MRISDWSSDVCSSDLAGFVGRHLRQQPGKQRENDKPRQQPQRRAVEPPPRPQGKATGDLAESGERINEIGAHSSDSLSASAASVTRRIGVVSVLPPRKYSPQPLLMPSLHRPFSPNRAASHPLRVIFAQTPQTN